MKRLIVSAFCLVPALAIAQDGFTVKGKVGELNAPAKAFLSYRAGAVSMTDSTELKDGAFTFTGKVADPTSATLIVKHSPVEIGKRVPTDGIALYLENKVITVNAADSVKFATISGSPINEENARLKAFVKPAADKMEALNKEYYSKTPAERKDEAFQKSLNDRADVITDEMNALNGTYAMAHTDTYIGLVAFRSSIGYAIDDATALPLYEKFSAEMKNTTLGKMLATNINAARLTKVGAMAMNFTQNDPDGKPVNLSDFRGKFLLVDFWASWCGPCRQENPNVVAAYNMYKDKNFTILGVSLDQPGKKDAWLKAVKDDGLTWTHVSDLQFWNNAVAKQYGIQSIPANFLIDPSGKIIGKNLRGEELKKKLAEVLGNEKSLGKL